MIPELTSNWMINCLRMRGWWIWLIFPSLTEVYACTIGCKIDIEISHSRFFKHDIISIASLIVDIHPEIESVIFIKYNSGLFTNINLLPWLVE